MNTRYSMIDRAVEAAKDIMDKSETFKERMEEALDSIAEGVEDLVDGDDEEDADEPEADES